MIITATEFRNHIGKYLTLASNKDIYITKNGKTVAMLTAPYQFKAQDTEDASNNANRTSNANAHIISRDEALLILKEAYNGCEKVFGHIKDAYLYGSYARGDYRDDSDVNILITIDLTEEAISKHHWDLAGLSSNLSLKHDITVNINIKSLDQFEKQYSLTPLYQEILKERIKYEG